MLLLQLRDIQDAQNQRSAEEVAASKPLAEVLRDAKEAKESAFQETWKQMKTVGSEAVPRPGSMVWMS